MKLLSATKLHLAFFSFLVLLALILFIDASIASSSTMQTIEFSTSVGNTQLVIPDHVFVGDTISTSILVDQYQSTLEGATIAGYILDIYSFGYEEEKQATFIEPNVSKAIWDVSVPQTTNDVVSFHYYALLQGEDGLSVSSELLSSQEVAVYYPGIEGSPCDAVHVCDEAQNLFCIDGYCVWQEIKGGIGDPCISWSQCDETQNLFCYCDYETNSLCEQGYCSEPIAVGLGDYCDGQYQYCETPLYCEESTMTCQEELTDSTTSPLYVNHGETCDDIDIFCDDGLYCDTTTQTCEYETELNLATSCEELICEQDHSCFAGTCIYCPEPYHVLNSDGNCVWSCAAGTEPQITQEGFGDCVCKEGFQPNGYDNFDRLICTVLPENYCDDVDIFCDEGYICKDQRCEQEETVLSSGNVANQERPEFPLDISSSLLQDKVYQTAAGVLHLYYYSPIEPSQRTTGYFELNFSDYFLQTYEAKEIYFTDANRETIASQSIGLADAIYETWDYALTQSASLNLYLATIDSLGNKKTFLLASFTVDVIEQEVDETITIDDNQMQEEQRVNQALEENQESETPLQTQEQEQQSRIVIEEIIKSQTLENLLKQEITEEEQAQQEQVKNLIKQREQIEEEEFVKREETARKQVSIEKQVQLRKIKTAQEEEDYATDILIHVKPKKHQKTIDIVEVIPKEVATHVNEITFYQEHIVLEEDPIVMWHLENVSEPITLTYSVKKNTSVTGNTIALATAQQESTFDSKTLLPLLFIPLIALLVIIFNRTRSGV